MAREPGGEVAVIGAGWAGLAAAIHLARAGRSVRLIDAAPQAGGRARRVSLNWKHPVHGAGPVDLDNGQHLLLGAYTEVLELLELVGALDEARLERRPMRLASSSGLLMERPDYGSRGPGLTRASARLAPLAHLSPLIALLRAQGLSLAARWAIMRVLVRLRLTGGLPPPGVTTVSEWYVQARQPQELIQRVWQPLVISALNTPADRACAATFLQVVRDSLGAAPEASDFILPRRNLSDLFVDPAIDWLQRHGVHLMLRTDVRRVGRGTTSRYRIAAGNRRAEEPRMFDCDELVVATPPYAAARLLTGLAHPSLVSQLNRFEYLPITTAYLGWPEHPLKPALLLPSLLSLEGCEDRQRYAQWFFDRGSQAHWRIASMVLSDSRVALELGDSRLADALTRQLMDELGLPPPPQLSLIHEKRATFACTPDRPRLHADAAWGALPGVALAGDYLCPMYPATLEAAARSGRMAAGTILGG